MIIAHSATHSQFGLQFCSQKVQQSEPSPAKLTITSAIGHRTRKFQYISIYIYNDIDDNDPLHFKNC